MDSELGLEGYRIFRQDRNENNSISLRGGGVLIAVRDNLVSRALAVSVGDVEQIFVDIKIDRLHVIACAVYFPPNSVSAVYESHCNAIEEVVLRSPNSELLIVGDFNLYRTKWFNDDNSLNYDINDSTHVGDRANVILQYYNVFDLRQFNQVRNQNNNTLDLVFSTINDFEVFPASESICACDPYHPALLFALPIFTRGSRSRTTEVRRNFRNADYIAINDYLASVPWDVEINRRDIFEAINFLYEQLGHVVNAYVPTYTVKKSPYPIWFTAELVSLTKAKKAAHHRYKISNRYSDYLEFNQLRAQCKQKSTLCWKNYTSRSECAINENVKTFWSFVNSLRDTNHLPNHIYYNNSVINDDSAIADIFADFFESVYMAKSDACHTVSCESVVEVANVSISVGEVFERIDGLQPFSHAGTDGFPPLFFISCRFVMARVLWILFNKSLFSGVFPDAWKATMVLPIFKSGEKTLVSNYRPISRQNVMPKIFENIIAFKLSSLCKNLIIDEQHGFVSGRSTTSNLLLYHDYIVSSLENRFQVDTIYTDFRKAFDTVDHSILISKLRAYGFHGNLLDWLSSYIGDRVQVVNFKGHLSREFKVTSGVPQGSHLGPLLFNLFINDIHLVFKFSKFLLYADDLKVYHTVDCSADAFRIQEDLLRLEAWSTVNKLYFNLDKCKVMHFTRKRSSCFHDYRLFGRTLAVADNIRDLGVYFCPDLSFDKHILMSTSKAYRMLGFVMRSCKYFNNPLTLKLLYTSLVRPLLEYATVVWASCNSKSSILIERIQHRFLRRISYYTADPMSFREHSYTRVMQEFNFLTLRDRRILIDMVFLHRLLNGHIVCPELLALMKLRVPSRSLRYGSIFHEETHRVSYGKFKPLNRICIEANGLHHLVDFFDLSLYALRSRLIAHFRV